MNANALEQFNKEINEARFLLTRAAARLDTARDTCRCCGVEKARAWKEYQAHEAITGMIDRLNTVQNKVRAEIRAKENRNEDDHDEP